MADRFRFTFRSNEKLKFIEKLKRRSQFYLSCLAAVFNGSDRGSIQHTLLPSVLIELSTDCVEPLRRFTWTSHKIVGVNKKMLPGATFSLVNQTLPSGNICYTRKNIARGNITLFPRATFHQLGKILSGQTSAYVPAK